MKNIVFYADCINKDCTEYFDDSRDNVNIQFKELKNHFIKNNFNFFTKYTMPKNSTVVLVHGLNDLDFNAIKKFSFRYVLLLESPQHDKGFYDTTLHQYFRKIFTWDDNLIDNKKYFKVNYSFEIPKVISKSFAHKKLCCMISGNKSSSHKEELYSKREELIRWFENNYPNDFDLYGFGWNRKNFGSSFFGKCLNNLTNLLNINILTYQSYRGEINSKKNTLEKYKFSICFENIKNQKGYITEKIFDSFFAGCIPIYLGANNILDYIPKNCFIDLRDFDNYFDLYKFISNLDENNYFNFISNIENFLKSKKIHKFRTSYFANVVVGEIDKDLSGVI